MKKIIIILLTISLFSSCTTTEKNVIKIEGSLISINDSISNNDAVLKMIEPYRGAVEKEMSTSLSYTVNELSKYDSPLETTLGNFMADLCFEEVDSLFKSDTGKSIDFALFNYGGLRANISQGNITKEDAFNLMPFENTFVIAELTYEKLNELFSYLVNGNSAHPFSKNLQLEISENGYSARINGKKPTQNKTYFVLTSNYLQKGGDKMMFFLNPVSLYDTEYKVRDGIINYLQKHDTINISLDGRFKKVNN